ncbi:sigma-70 family RNA polymerase sigma factor [Gordonia sp. X0973]|uniref:RNA polymerase sigma factor n=1 Tax=Gordonia sp. X0973 TaxID=2742602 RepID=UPI000F53AF97|nr:sigma-70 family RNA polymerase sigma factor [Gordonia sp. X0973]QKT08500.1 sigma-70 family RNA polymerase sigma factor [Gordonia sp. X0973]
MDGGFEGIYREHVTPLWRYVRVRVPCDADAEDVISEVFVAAMKSWERYDPAHGTVGAWLTGIARHGVADWWRRSGREIPVEAVADDRPATEDDPESATLRRLADDEVRAHLAVLTTRERDAVALRFGARLSSPEIGAALGISAPAARMLVYRAVGKLRKEVV